MQMYIDKFGTDLCEISVDAFVASFTKEVNSRLAKRPLVFNARLANHGLTSLVKRSLAPTP